MRRTYTLKKRIIAMLLCVAMVAAYLPGMVVSVSAAASSSKTADPSTMHDWKAFFGPDVLNTEFAGGVWTDKSVFTDNTEFPGVTMQDNDSLLVALSAIAANKQVEGQSKSPTDTMLVLDLSNSMDNIQAIPDMVSAANAAIHKLLNMNNYNRVGVVLYSGNSTQGNASASTATVILPLGQYKPNANNKYLDYTGSSNNTTVIRAEGMTNRDGTAVTGTASKQTNGATYIQNGLYKAWQEFDAVTDTTVTSGIMAGTKRTPVYILMSDGEPTVATTAYNNVNTSNVGNGKTPGSQTTRNQLTFLTQLTASWAKGKAEDKYGTNALFYTLGLGISENESATAVLSPASTNETVSGWWTNFLAGTADQNVTVYGSNWNAWSLYRDAAVVERNYVDAFWSADKASDLPAAFDKIAQAIEVESAYSATLVTTDNYDMDGYITFEDEIGELMEVKDIKGILLGSTLFSGAELAKSMGEGLLGGSSNPKDLGIELVATVQERIGIEDVSVAQQLIRSAYKSGQLSYDTATGAYSNYIGWYADENGAFIQFWQESYGYTMEGAPQNAKYINKSYGYLGEAGDSNMMHVVVQVSTEIKTSHQTVLFKIPASLIPTVTYKVELSGTELETATKLTREDAEPMRLLFEVGLRSDINAINLEEKVAQYLAEDPAHHIHQNADGTYTFYTNSWGHGDEDQAPEYSEALMDVVAESHFHPSYQNERYYYTEPTAIYVKEGNNYSLYTGTAQPQGTGYYHRRTVVAAATNGGTASIDYIFAPISAVTLADTANLTHNGGNWYVNEGVAYAETARFDILKNPNATETLPHANYPVVIHDADGYNIYAVLGNNGKLTVEPAQGIKLSKIVSQVAADANAPTAFTFTVTFDADIARGNIKLTDAGETPFAGDYSIASSGGKTVVTVTLANGQEVYITGIPTNTAYTVHEEQTVYYNSDKANDTVTGVVDAFHIDDVVFTNSPRQYGQLTITKTVEHPFAGRPAALENILFTFQVDLGAQAAGMSFPLADGSTTPAADENGVITMTIKAEQTITIQGILEDTPYTVTEINIPQGFAWDAAASSGLSGRVGGAAHLVNKYIPTPPVTNPNVDIVINKSLTGDYTQDETFVFQVEKLNPVTNQYEVLGNKEVRVAWPTTSTGTVSLSDLVSGFTTLGSHTFRITEVSGSTVGMTYSNQIATFQVNVVDPEMDGSLEIQVVGLTNTTVNQSNTGYVVTADFTNIYYVGSTHVDVQIRKNLVNETGVDIPVTDFRFGLYADAACTQLVQIVAGEHLTVYAGPLGTAVIRIPVTNVNQNGAVYYIKEIVPQQSLAGMHYSNAVYQVTLDVEAVQQSGNGQLTAQATITLHAGEGQVNGSEVLFTNVFSLQETSAVIEGTKSFIRGYDNTALDMKEFSFELWTANADYTPGTKLATVKNDANGVFRFSGLEALTYSKVGRYTYILREVPGSDSTITYDAKVYYVLVIVTQGEGDKLTAQVHYRAEGAAAGTDKAVFTNVYNVSGQTNTVIRGSKQLNVIQGHKVLVGGDFTFGLYAGTDTTAQPIDAATNRANGEFVFDTITYTAEQVGQTFTYTVKEIIPAGAVKNNDGTYTLGGVTYSNASFEVQVQIKDNGDGTISAVQTLVGADSITFVNDYKAADAAYTVSGRKILTGRDLKADEFTFFLYETGADFAVQGAPIATVKNGEDGSFSFDPITYSAVGTHYYVVREYIPAVDAIDRLGGVHYDAGVYQITVQVADGGTGALAASATIRRPGSTSTEVVFRNGYTTEPAVVVLEAQKSYNKPLEGNDFTFTLKGQIGETKIDQEKKNDSTGKITFDQLTFDKADTYTFQVAEQAKFLWIEYDKTTYTVTITVTDNGAGQLEAEIAYTTADGNATGMSFNNTYKIIENAAVTLGGSKQFLGGQLTAGAFGFGLYADAACTQQIGQTVYNTVESANLGRFEFPEIVYENIQLDALPATYTYYIREVLPDGVQQVDDGNGGFKYVLDGVTYDTTIYTVDVVLTDNGTGGVNVKTLVNGAENGQITFTNTYGVSGTAELTLGGNKLYTNSLTNTLKDLPADTFQFNLSGNGINETVSNKQGGAFSFSAITFDQDDIREEPYVYTVTEVAGNLDYVVYDQDVYTVAVTVSDNGKGGVKVDKVITLNSNETATIVFDNYYNVIKTGTVEITGTKTYTDSRTNQSKEMDAGMFTFKLEGDGKELTATNDASGNFKFQLSYTKEDIGNEYTYTISEVAGDKTYITYDPDTFQVKVKIEDDGQGGLKITKTLLGNESLGFQNYYNITGTGVLELTGTKTLTGRTLKDGEFTFGLFLNGKQIDSATNGNGIFTLKASYTAADLGSYTYTVSEIDNGTKDITFDKTVYTVKVNVFDDGKGGIGVEYQLEGGEKLSFENAYTPQMTPQTGDSFHAGLFITLMVLSSFGLAAVVISKKNEEKKTAE